METRHAESDRSIGRGIGGNQGNREEKAGGGGWREEEGEEGRGREKCGGLGRSRLV